MFEEGSRLFDIKRRNESIDRSLSVNAPIAELSYINAVKYNGQDNRMIYQIPDAEIQNNPEITVQNPPIRPIKRVRALSTDRLHQSNPRFHMAETGDCSVGGQRQFRFCPFDF